MADIFNEIDEELRKDKAQEWWGRYGKFVIGACVVVVAAAGGYTWFEQQRTAELRELADRYGHALTQADAGETDPALAALQSLSQEADGEGIAMIASFQRAGILADQDRHAEAAEVYAAVAADDGVDPLYRGLAELKAILHRSVAGEDTAALLTEIEPLTLEGEPWRYSARMVAASLAMGAGDMEKAKAYLTQVSDDDGAPNSARTQAVEILQAIGS